MTPFRYLLRGLGSNRVRTRPDHPDPLLRSRRYPLPADAVWSATLALAESMTRWRIAERDDRRTLARVEARSRLWRFVDDVEIRVHPEGDASARVEMSSASRVGRSDFGVNARRIAHFLQTLDSRLATDARASGSRPRDGA